MAYTPHTADDIKHMLDVIGAKSIDDLFDEIPAAVRAKPLSAIPDGQSEMQVLRTMQDRANQDSGYLNFIGAGAYEHHVPAAVWELATRGEFYTAYTPYQAEASQGTLQVIFEYQTMMASLTGMDVSNATVYDGGSGLAEAVLMAIRANRKSKSNQVLIADNVNPRYTQATKAIVENQEVSLQSLPFNSATGVIDTSHLGEFEGQDFAALIIAQPNFFGCLEDVDALTDWAHAQGMLVIAAVNPTSLALLNPPGQWGEAGADIAVGDGQPLGVPLSSGGPYFGFMCCKQKIVRQMPGRIIGQTVDLDGNTGYVLTLQAREQHIRRSKATSNICTNQGLAMTAGTIYMSLLGPEGLKSVALASHQNTVKLADKLCQLPGVERCFDTPFFHEVAIRLPVEAQSILDALAKQHILAGRSLADFGEPNALLLCATETKIEADLDQLVTAIQSELEAV
ncbi:MAG: aminomethyl-transferring glycine dehydrogenase subunit GcvPA [Pseudomonadota bacterium]|nr:aminomethyl-transferring glycine dehydrogenase subunit GcvPA [Pseudomonadota bacterium]